MKFEVTVKYVYDVDTRDTQATFGTTQPREIAMMDRARLKHQPHLIFTDLIHNVYTVRVRPLPGENNEDH